MLVVITNYSCGFREGKRISKILQAQVGLVEKLGKQQRETEHCRQMESSTEMAEAVFGMVWKEHNSTDEELNKVDMGRIYLSSLN